MKKNYISYLTILYFFYTTLAITTASAQSRISQFTQAGLVGDANKLGEAYITPLNHAFGNLLNQGWFNTGEALRTGRFELRIITSAVLVPAEAESFDINSLNLQSGFRVEQGSSQTPTFFGGDSDGPTLIQRYNPPQVTTPSTIQFNAPQGIGLPLFALPMIQAGVGIWKGLELNLRFFPELEIPTTDNSSSFALKMFGVGAKWEFQQFVPIINLWRVHMSLGVGYTQLSASTTLNQPENVGIPYLSGITTPTAGFYDSQSAGYNVRGFNINLLISKKIRLLTLYSAFRYESSSASISVAGNYPFLLIETNASNPNFNRIAQSYISNPIDINTSFQQASLSLGFRLRFLSIVTFNLEGTYGTKGYHNASFGLGFGRFN